MARKKKRIGLPRVTVLAYSKRDLVAFSTAVESLQRVAAEMSQILPTIAAAASAIADQAAAGGKPRKLKTGAAGGQPPAQEANPPGLGDRLKEFQEKVNGK